MRSLLTVKDRLQRLYRFYQRSRPLIRCSILGILCTLAVLVLVRLTWSGPRDDSEVNIEWPSPKMFINEAPWAAKRAAEDDKSKFYIPKMIHHYFGSAIGIPARLVPEVDSWAVNHPNFEVHYWDTATVETSLLNKKEYASYQRYYWNGTRSPPERDMIARLLILHSFGGLLPDLNMRSLRNSTPYLLESSCVVAQERNEKAVFQHDFESLPSLAFLACTPQHHFVTYFLRKITEVSLRTGAVVLQVDTPAFLLHSFNSAVAAYDEDCLTRADCQYQDRVSLADPVIFMPVMEPHLFDSLVDNCRQRHQLPFLKKEACYNLDANGNQPSEASLAMPVYLPASAPNKDRPLLPLTKIGPSSQAVAALKLRPRKHWQFSGGESFRDTSLKMWTPH